jgi:hypothetical protein
MIKLKDGVTWEGVQPEIMVGLSYLYASFIIHDQFMLVVTSTRYDYDKHMKGSKHYEGQAIDIRSRNIPQNERYLILSHAVKSLAKYHGKDYYLFLEAKGTPNEHYHLEYDPK